MPDDIKNPLRRLIDDDNAPVPTPGTGRSGMLGLAARWMVTFVGFPLGSFGAITVTALTAVLPLIINPSDTTRVK